ncbi:MAG: PH domain-containing protein [Nocardioidaceae bacterium]
MTDPEVPSPEARSPEPSTALPSADEGWQRLDPRMLLVGPVQTLKQFAIPAIIALVGINSGGGFNPVLTGLTIGVPILLGFLPWLTTRYRMTDTQFQLRKGLLNRQQVTAPLDRVRSVDLEASLMHRLLGLTKVKVGTGVDETRIELNALSVAQADELRHLLVARSLAVWDPSATKRPSDLQFVPQGEIGIAEDYDARGAATAGARQPAASSYVAPQVLAVIDWSWLRFAPFSLSRLAIVAGAIGALAQWGDSLPFLDAEHVDEAYRWVLGFAIPLVVLTALVGVLAGWLAISIAGYALQWWDLRLVREHGTIRLTAGALTTRSTSVQEARVRGVELVEPVLLRLVHGAELATLATGVGSGGVTKVLPPCPREVCQQVGHAILDADAPLGEPLHQHGSVARRRCYVRNQWVTLIATALSVVPTIALDLPRWLPVLVLVVFGAWGVLLGTLEYRHLGHLLTEEHLAAGSGALVRRRTVLERDGIIGWVVRQTFFQRRRGLATLVATTAAGTERVEVRDLPLARAVELARATTPEAVTPFLAAPAGSGR